jgi:hypothetical protein
MSAKFTFTFPAIITSYDPKVHKSFKAYIDHLKANIGERFNAKTNVRCDLNRGLGSQNYVDRTDVHRIQTFIRDKEIGDSDVNEILQFCIDSDKKSINHHRLYTINDLMKLYGGKVNSDTVKMYLEFAQQINLDELEVNDCLIAGIAKIPKKESETKQESDNASIAELQNRIKEAEQNFNASEKEKSELEIKYTSLQNRHAEAMALLNQPTTQSIITG